MYGQPVGRDTFGRDSGTFVKSECTSGPSVECWGIWSNFWKPSMCV